MPQIIQKLSSKPRILPIPSKPLKRTSSPLKKHKQQITTNIIGTSNSTLAIKFYYPPRISNSLHLHLLPHASFFRASSDPSQSRQKYLPSHTNSTSRQQCEYTRHFMCHS